MPSDSARRWRALEWGVLALLGLVALATRVVNVDRYTGSYPEGVRAEQLLLMSLGFRPFRDIFSDQGPWLLDVLYPGFALFGPNLVGVRAVVVLASLVGLAGAWWLARSLGGRLAGVATVALLIASPTYLKFSRLAVAELVALAPATLALAAAVRYSLGGGRRWLAAAGVLFATSLLIKPIALAAGPAIAVAVLTRSDRWRAMLVVAGATLATLVGGMLLVGLPEIISQIVLFRLQSREVEGWRLADNLARAQEELSDEGLAFYLLGALGLGVALLRRPTWPLAVWMLGALATVAAHSPLHAKHFTIVMIPAALLAGLPLGALGRLWSGVERSKPRLALAALAVSLLGLYALTLPDLLTRDAAALSRADLFDRDASIHWYDDAVQTLASTTPPGSYVVTDHAYLAFAAGRPVPPYLAEASVTRVRAGSLTDAEAIEHTRAFDSQAVLLWADKLVGLKHYRAWLQEEFLLARVWATENDTRPELWLPRTAPLEAYRRTMRAGLTEGPPEALDGRLRAVAWGPRVQAAGAGEVARLTVEWEAVQPVPADTLIEVGVRGAGGEAIDDERESLLGGRHLLEPGWWMSWVGGVRLPEVIEPGDYQLYVRLRDRVNRRLTDEIAVGTVQILPP